MHIRQNRVASFDTPSAVIPEPWLVRTDSWMFLGGAELRSEKLRVDRSSIWDGLAFYVYVSSEPQFDEMPDLPDYDSWDDAVDGNSATGH